MHISEGVLRPEILIGGAVVASAVTAYALYRLKSESIPTVSAFSALFFLASFVHVPIGVTSAHLILSGLVGAILGLEAFVAIGVALLFQGVLFAFGGITTLGINLCVLATPALIARAIFVCKAPNKAAQNAQWFLTGFVPIAFGAFLLSAVLALNGEGFYAAAKLAFVAHIPVMIIEGIITMLALNFIRKVRPQLLEIKV
ncbi:MAG: cobalt transporter CbiM [Helicobacteraceae bacterium]|jgi:cobalt/nickel transport system permease protein|nr:cobalt transporter CbiM [Helicobacteraceae bacterium]